MKLSSGERLILVMLADLLKATKANGEINPDLVLEAVTSGHFWALKWEYPGVFDSEDDSDEVVKETADILDMCRIVENSINDLEQSDRGTIPTTHRQLFFGFDANNEPHYGVARTLIETLGRWEEFKGRSLNSHYPVIDNYRDKLIVFKAAPRAAGGGLALDQIRKVLDA